MYNHNELSAVELSPTKKDYYQIWSELIDVAGKLSDRWDPSATNESDPGIVLLKVLTAVADKLAYNIDANTLEAFMPSAAQEASMRKLCDMLGYTMKYYNSATTTAKITYQGDTFPSTNNIHIDRFTNLKDKDGTINYVTLADVVLNANKLSQTVSCMEGELLTCETNVGQVVTQEHLDDNNRFYLPETQIAANGVFVSNMSNPNSFWKSVDNLNTALLGDAVYKFGYDSSLGVPYLQFPDDVASLMGTGLVIRFIRTRGVRGNIATGALSTMEKPLSWSMVSASEAKTVTSEDIVNGSTSGDDAEWQSVDNYTVFNIAAAQNGKDPETIDEAYWNFQKNIGTFDTLVTCRDYMNKIYQMTRSDVDTTPLVSNIIVSDVRDDINRAYTVCAMTDQGIEYKNTIETTPDGKLAMNYFDLMLYPFETVYGLGDQGEYLNSFKYTNKRVLDIVAQLEDSKTIAHNFIRPSDDEIACVKVYFQLSARLNTTSRINILEAAEVSQVAHRALYKQFNLRHMTFGEELPYDSILSALTYADPRIKNVSLDDPKMYLVVCTASGNEYPITGDYVFTNLEAAKKARDFYLELVTRNVLAGRVQLLNYKNTFATNYTDAIYPAGKAETSISASRLILNKDDRFSEKLLNIKDSSAAGINITDIPFRHKDGTQGLTSLTTHKQPNGNLVVDFASAEKTVFLTDKTCNLMFNLAVENGGQTLTTEQVKEVFALIKNLTFNLYGPGDALPAFKLKYSPVYTSEQLPYLLRANVSKINDMGEEEIIQAADVLDSNAFITQLNISPDLGEDNNLPLCCVPLNMKDADVVIDKVGIELIANLDRLNMAVDSSQTEPMTLFEQTKLTAKLYGDEPVYTETLNGVKVTVEKVMPGNVEQKTVELELKGDTTLLLVEQLTDPKNPEITKSSCELEFKACEDYENKGYTYEDISDAIASVSVKTYQKGQAVDPSSSAIPHEADCTISLEGQTLNLIVGPLDESYVSCELGTIALKADKADNTDNTDKTCLSAEFTRRNLSGSNDSRILDKVKTSILVECKKDPEKESQLTAMLKLKLGEQSDEQALPLADFLPYLQGHFETHDVQLDYEFTQDNTGEWTPKISSHTLSLDSANCLAVRVTMDFEGANIFEGISEEVSRTISCLIRTPYKIALVENKDPSYPGFDWVVGDDSAPFKTLSKGDVLVSADLSGASCKVKIGKQEPPLELEEAYSSFDGDDFFAQYFELIPAAGGWKYTEQTKMACLNSPLAFNNIKTGEGLPTITCNINGISKILVTINYKADSDWWEKENPILTVGVTPITDPKAIEYPIFLGAGDDTYVTLDPSSDDSDELKLISSTEADNVPDTLPAITKISTEFRVDTQHISATEPLTLSEHEVIQFRAPNFKTMATFPAYVNYFVKLNKGSSDSDRSVTKKSTPAIPATMQTLLEFFAGGLENYAEDDNWNPKVSWEEKVNSMPDGIMAVILETDDEIKAGTGEETQVNYKYESAIKTYGALFIKEGNTYKYFEKTTGDSIPPSTQFYGVVLTEENYMTFISWLQGTKGNELTGQTITYREDVSVKLTANVAPFKLSREKAIKGIYTASRPSTTRAVGQLVDDLKRKFTLEDSYPTGKTLKTLFVPRLWNNTTSGHTQDGLGTNAVTYGIPANTEYQLGKGEYVLFSYSTSEGREDGVAVVKNQAFGPGEIIKANFELIDSEELAFAKNYNKVSDYGPWTLADKTIIKASQVPGMFTLGAQDQIEAREKIEVTLDGATTLLFWEIHSPYISDDGYEYFPKNAKTNKYILQPGEYLFYTDASQEGMAYYGAGTEIRFSGYTPTIRRPAGMNTISAEKINEVGLISAIPWTTFNLRGNGTGNAAITIAEYQYIDLINGDSLEEITFKIEDGEDAPSPILSNEFRAVESASYVSGGMENSLPRLAMTDCYWEAMGKLELAMGPSLPQVLNVHKTSAGKEIARDVVYLWGLDNDDNEVITQVYTPLVSADSGDKATGDGSSNIPSLSQEETATTKAAIDKLNALLGGTLAGETPEDQKLTDEDISNINEQLNSNAETFKLIGKLNATDTNPDPDGSGLLAAQLVVNLAELDEELKNTLSGLADLINSGDTVSFDLDLSGVANKPEDEVERFNEAVEANQIVTIEVDALNIKAPDSDEDPICGITVMCASLPDLSALDNPDDSGGLTEEQRAKLAAAQGKAPVPISLYSNVDILGATGSVSFVPTKADETLPVVEFKSCQYKPLTLSNGEIFAPTAEIAGFSQIALGINHLAANTPVLTLNVIIPRNAFGLLSFYYLPSGTLQKEQYIYVTSKLLNNSKTAQKLSIFNYADDSWWSKTDKVANSAEYGHTSGDRHYLRHGLNTIKILPSDMSKDSAYEIQIYAQAKCTASLYLGQLQLVPIESQLNPQLAFGFAENRNKRPFAFFNLADTVDTSSFTDDGFKEYQGQKGLYITQDMVYNKIRELDPAYDFFYMVPADNNFGLNMNELDVSDTMLEPKNWFNPQNIANKFVVSEIDVAYLQSFVDVSKNSRSLT